MRGWIRQCTQCAYTPLIRYPYPSHSPPLVPFLSPRLLSLTLTRYIHPSLTRSPLLPQVNPPHLFISNSASWASFCGDTRSCKLHEYIYPGSRFSSLMSLTWILIVNWILRLSFFLKSYCCWRGSLLVRKFTCMERNNRCKTVDPWIDHSQFIPNWQIIRIFFILENYYSKVTKNDNNLTVM